MEGRRCKGLTGIPNIRLSLDGALNHCGGTGRFLQVEGRSSDMAMHVLGTRYRERCPGAHRLCAGAACGSALEIFCSQGL